MMTLRKHVLSSALLMGLSLAAACGDAPTQAGGGVGGGNGGGGGGNPGPVVVTDSGSVAGVQLASDTMTLLAMGGHRRLEATARNPYGAVLQGRGISYASSDLAVAVVDASGNVTAMNPGRATITASLEGKQAQARVEVLPLTVDSIAMGARWIRVQWGTTSSLGASLYAADGRPLSDRAIAWTTSDSTVATVDWLGQVTGVRGGRAWITATSEGRSARAEVIVPDVRELKLATAGGTALPAMVLDSLHDDGDGNFRRVRGVAIEGTLRLDSRSNMYEQEVVMRVTKVYLSCTPWLSCIASRPEEVEVRRVFDRGTLLRNQFTGEPIFESAVYPGWTYYAQAASADGLMVWQTLPGTDTRLPWVYRP